MASVSASPSEVTYSDAPGGGLIGDFELWRSDGTAAGTVLFHEFNPGSGAGISWAPALRYWGGKLLLGRSGELWLSDGTEAGTTRLPVDGQIYMEFVEARGALFSVGRYGSDYAIWRTDGTAGGTFVIERFSTLSGRPKNLSVVGDQLLFTQSNAAGTIVWRSDGTDAGTSDPIPGYDEYIAAVAGPLLYFRLQHPELGAELWRSDGTSAGTGLVRDIYPGDGHGDFGR